MSELSNLIAERSSIMKEVFKEVFIVTAVHDNDGVVIQEVFENQQKALDFESKNIRQHLLKHYGENMLRSYDEDKIAISFHVRTIKI